MATADEHGSFLEIDDEPVAPPPASADPTPDLPLTRDDEAFLEVVDADTVRGAAARVVSDDDLALVSALADDTLPLLAALWPAVADLAADPPSAEALDARIALARRLFNQVTRRGPEWRARAEVAASALTRRLDALRGAPLRDGALVQLRAHHTRALDALIAAESSRDGRLCALECARVTAEARRRGLDDDLVRARCEALGVAFLPGQSSAWAPLDALPGSPTSLDAVAACLATAPAQCAAALRDGALSAWLRAHRAPAGLCDVAVAAEALVARENPDDGALSPKARVALASLAWALGREGVAVEGVVVTTAEGLKTHLRNGTLHDGPLAEQGELLGQWFRSRGEHGVAVACEALGRGEAHAAWRLRWALGEPLRVGQRPVADPSQLAREMLQRPAARVDALARWRDGSLAAWLDALPRTKRDPLWHDELRQAPDDPRALWRGVYRRVPRAPLRLHLGEALGHRTARFDGVGDLHAGARVAAVWPWLREALAAGELDAWLAVAAPGLERTPVGGSDDLGLHQTLWDVGFTGLVLPWGRGGRAVGTPADLVAAWRKGAAQTEAAVASGLVAAWLVRFHPGLGVPGMDVRAAVALWGERFGAEASAAGTAALRVALLCGLDELPLDPGTASGASTGRHGYVGLDGTQHDPTLWEPLVHPQGAHYVAGTVQLWAARHAPALGLVVARMAAGEALPAEELRGLLAEAGVPRASEALAEVQAATARLKAQESARRAMEEEAARLALARETARLQRERDHARREAERDALQRAAERDALKREMQREVERLTAERDAARTAMEQTLARLARERASFQQELYAARTEAEVRLEAQRLEALAAAEALREARDAALRRALEAERLAALPVVVMPLDGPAFDDDRAPAHAPAPLPPPPPEATPEALQALAADAKRAAEEAVAYALQQAAAEAEARDRAAETEHEARARDLEARHARTEAERDAETQRIAAEADRARAEADRLEAELAATRALLDTPQDEADDDTALLAALEGVLESEAELAPDIEFDEAAALPERHEIRHELLATAYAVTDEAELAPLRAAMDAWARQRPQHPLADLAQTMESVTVTLVPCFELHAATRFESRALTLREGDIPVEDDPVPVLPEAVDGETGALDPWLLPLAEVDTWGRWESVIPLDHSVDALECPDCAPAEGSALPVGRVACRRCHGERSVACRSCNGWGSGRCPHCHGNGMVPQGATSVRCRPCDGRGTLPCADCTMGREPCPDCEAEGQCDCPRCGGDGRVGRHAVVTQTFLGVAARSVVGAEGVPSQVLESITAAACEPLPVMHLEAPELDPAGLAQEVAHPALGAAAAQLLAEETARATEGQRVARQRLVVRRYPVWRVAYTHAGEAYTLWVYGPGRAVLATRSPLSRYLDDRVTGAQEAVVHEDVGSAVEALRAVLAVDPDHPGAREAATSLGAAVLAMAQRGELFAAREAADLAAPLRWPGCVQRLLETERVLGRRLQSTRAWALAEEADALLGRGHLVRCAEQLAALHSADPAYTDGDALAARLGERWAAEAEVLLARGDAAGAWALVQRARAVPWGACAAAMDAVAARAKRGAWAVYGRQWAPWVALALGGVMFVAGAVALLSR
jgi:hypothetical protein